MPGDSQHYRKAKRKGLASFGGIVAGFVSDFAHALDVDTDELITALDGELETLTHLPNDDPSYYHVSFLPDQLRMLKKELR
jgi:hypothetical protein